MKFENYTQEIEIPQDVEVKIENGVFTFKGQKGEFQRDLSSKKIAYSIKDNKITLLVKVATKKEKMIVATMTAHIRNGMKGVAEGFTYKLAICSGHFPMSVSFSNNELTVKNFLGEAVPRRVKISPEVDVKVNDKVIEVTGINIEKVGDAASRIEHLTVRPGFDKRRFQDGIYITEKHGKQM